MATTVRVTDRIARLTPRNNILFLNGKHRLYNKHLFRFSNFIAINDSKYIEIKIICKLGNKCLK